MWWRGFATPTVSPAEQRPPDPGAGREPLRARGRPRLRRRTPGPALLAGAAAGTVGLAALAAGRHASSVALRPLRTGPPGSEQVVVHDATPDTVTLARTPVSTRPGTYGLTGTTCHAVLGDVLSTTDDAVTRRLTRVDRGTLDRRTRGVFTPQAYTGDPRSARDLDYRDVTVPGDLGPLPCWMLPGVRKVWVVAVHGLGATREQTLALLPTLCALHLPVLSVSYRNDPAAPRSPDHLGHLGDTEWHDLDAALRFAVEHGARQVVVVGWSVGATMALYAAHRSPLRGAVGGLVLDSPVLDWETTLRRLAVRRGVPAALLPLLLRAAEGRGVLPGDRLRRASRPEALFVPTLLVHGPDDTVAPWDRTRALARDRADLATLYRVPGADHAAMWNADPDGYEEQVRRFLVPLL
ncbi:alpha/beta hydrolase [Wenjunlia vitaminophila]|uniref:alpha/beta hydrolase n=1 Tax=Wenjunlia vitaminophila TaxID=76728 RepID=UPI00037FBAD4|nr:alpha/beta hydrolase [Wenjunlia vitaminophila]